MPVSPRTILSEIQTSAHGGPNFREAEELGLDVERLLDFSVNANPADPPPELRAVLQKVDIRDYPDGDSLALRRAAAARFQVSENQILAGNGSSELLWLICLAYLNPSDRVLIGQPSFGEYEVAARLHGGAVARYSEMALGDRAQQISAAVRDLGPKLVFICNPNNPTGGLTPTDKIEALAGESPETLFVVDEAYADFVLGFRSAIRAAMPRNLVVLRSMTKFAALAGLRLGFAFGSPEVIAAISKTKPPWNVNTFAQAAGLYALEHPELGPDLETLENSRSRLVQALQNLGLEPLPTTCNYFLVPVEGLAVRVAAGETAAAGVRHALLAYGCIVRDCSSFGMPGHIRISVRAWHECERLIEAFTHIMKPRIEGDTPASLTDVSP